MKIEEATVEVRKVDGLVQIVERMQAHHKKMKQETEDNKTRFLMVENFVEKYQPILVQIAISRTLSACLYDNDSLNALESFEAKKFGELHQTILLDEGMPELVKKVNEIKRQVEAKLGISSVSGSISGQTKNTGFKRRGTVLGAINR